MRGPPDGLSAIDSTHRRRVARILVVAVYSRATTSNPSDNVSQVGAVALRRRPCHRRPSLLPPNIAGLGSKAISTGPQRGEQWLTTSCPTCPTTTGHSSRTSPARSWSCTTTSTTRPTSRALNTALDQLAEARDKDSFGVDRRAGEDPRLPPRRAHQPLGLLAEPVPRRRRQAGRRAGRGDRRVLRLLRRVPGPLHGERQRHPGLRLVDPGLGHPRAAAEHRPAVRPAGQPAARRRSRSCCSTCGSTRSTCSTRTSRPTT